MRHHWKKAISLVLAGVLSTGLLAWHSTDRVALAADTAGTGVKEIPGTTHEEKEFDSTFLSIAGYATGSKYNVTGAAGVEEGDTRYVKVYSSEEFLLALARVGSGQVKVIEVCADLDLGYNMLTPAAKSSGVIEAYEKSEVLAGCSMTNPDLMKSGISLVSIKNANGVTIFSKGGYALKHAEFKLQANCSNVVIRNLRFEGMWEWDDWQEEGYAAHPAYKGDHKRTGWTNLKVNGASRVWIDHCDFGIAMDGCVDISGTQEGEGCEGISITWCTFGKESMEPGSMLYNTKEYLESIYQESKEEGSNVKSFAIYEILRDNGFTPDECMLYGYLHSKCHLTGDGDKDYDKNPLTRYTLAYNQYYNMQQRVPMVRQGSVHLYNCLIDYNYRNRKAVIDKIYEKDAEGLTIRNKIEAAGGSVWALFRAIDARNGASVAADTCVYNCVDSPITGSERHLDGGNLQDIPSYGKHDFGYNHPLIVNSSVTKWTNGAVGEAYVGSSWDDNGENPFNSQFTWSVPKDQKRPTIGNWTWKQLTPDTVDQAERDVFDKYINQKDDELPYTYQTVALDKVEDTVKTYGGAGVLKMSAEDWLKTNYAADYKIQFQDEKNDAVTGITLDETKATLADSERLQLYAALTPATATGTSVKWESSDESIATVGQGGLVTPKKPGVVTIAAIAAEGIKAECEVEVYVLPTSIAISGLPNSIYVGDAYPADAVLEPEAVSKKNLVWTSTMEQYLTVDEEGIVRGIAAGRGGRIGVNGGVVGNMIWNKTGVSAVKSVNVVACPNPVTSVALSAENVTLNMDVSSEAVRLTATAEAVDPSKAPTNSRIRWSSSDESVVKVEDGVLIPVSSGQAVVTVTTINNEKTAECVVTVLQKTVEPEPVYKKGDVNNDGEADTDDAVAILKHAVGMDPLTGAAALAADVNKDDAIDTDDAVEILKYAVGLIDEEEWNKEEGTQEK